MSTSTSPQRGLLKEVRQIVRDGVQAAHPWFRDPRTWPAGVDLPRTIPGERVQELLRALLGSEANQDPVRDLFSLTVHRHAIEVEVLAKDAEGRRFMRDDEIAIDSIHLRVTW